MTPLQQTLLSEFREKFDHDNPGGKAIVLIESTDSGTSQRPIGKELESFLLNALERVEKEVTEQFFESNGKTQPLDTIVEEQVVKAESAWHRKMEQAVKAERLRIASLPEMEEEKECEEPRFCIDRKHEDARKRNSLRREIKKQLGV